MAQRSPQTNGEPICLDMIQRKDSRKMMTSVDGDLLPKLLK
jgi:hypothetical protein